MKTPVHLLNYYRLVYEGFRKYLVFEDIYKLPKDLTCDHLLPSFTQAWEKEVKKLINPDKKMKNEKKRNKIADEEVVKEEKDIDHGAMTLVWAIIRSCGWSYGLAIIFRWLTMIIIYFNPILLG